MDRENMSGSSAEPDGPTAVQAFQFWWLHDARWYQGVLRRFGQEAANEINAEALGFVARRVAKWHARAHPLDASTVTAAELAGHLDALLRLMGSEIGSQVRQEVLSADEVDTAISENFALRMLRAARSLDGYDCPCLSLRAGWFDGLGVEVEDKCVECMRFGDTVCRFRATVRRAVA